MNEMSTFANDIMQNRYAHDLPANYKEPARKESWSEIAGRTTTAVLAPLKIEFSLINKVMRAIERRQFMPGGRYLYAAGRPYHQTQNCVLMRAQDTRQGWGNLMSNVTMSLMTGAGLGVQYSALRPEGSPLHSAGGTSSGPIALMQMVNEVARGARQGGSRRGAIWAGLSWKHVDTVKFIVSKDWSDDIKALKAKDFNAVAPLDHTNISVCLDDEFFKAYEMRWHPLHETAQAVYWKTVYNMLSTGEPGFSIDIGKNAGEDLRNACTEITSADDSDICNLGSVNLARVDNIDEFRELVKLGILFLMAGTVYSDVPYEAVYYTRGKNRRLGLGLMGVHEWLLKRGKQYGPDEELAQWLSAYVSESCESARVYAKEYSLTEPVKTRAIAPNGTIGIVAETTTSAEPMFCSQYMRRFRDGNMWKYQYVIDPTAARLIEQGHDPGSIEDAYTLAADPERRLSMQAFLQTYVDHAISSTINLPPWGTELNNESTVQDFGTRLMKYLPHLRGITVYPDGARGGQPLNRVTYEEAASAVGETFIEGADICDITKGGSCGS